MSANPLVANLTRRRLVRVSGADWRGFLQGLLTQDVEGLAAGEVRFAALLTPQGRLLYDLFLIADDEGCLIDVASDHREALIERLSLYRLRAKVEIAAAEGEVLALWSSDRAPDGPGWTPDPRLPALGWRGYGAAAPSGAIVADDDAYDAHRLALGVPDAGLDCPPDTTFPIEANFDLLHGIDFKKGCFVGQETTSRMKRRGAIKSRMVGLSFDGPTPPFGAEVLAGDLRAGDVRTGVGGRALALARLDRIVGGDLTVDGLPARLERPDYLPIGDD